MKRKFTCFTSVVLALLMTVSSIAVSGPSEVYATNENTVDETVQISQIAADDVAINADDTDAITVDATDDKVKASVSIDASDEAIVLDDSGEYAAGDSIPLHMEASNQTDEDVEFRVYFWDYAETLPSDKNTWDSVLNVPVDTIEITELQETDFYPVQLYYDGENKKADVTYQTEVKQDVVQSAYLSVIVPAGYDFDTVVHMVLDNAKTVTIVPVIDEMTGDAIQATWSEEEITVETVKEPEEPEIEIEGPTEETDTDIVIEEGSSDSFPSIFFGDIVEDDEIGAEEESDGLESVVVEPEEDMDIEISPETDVDVETGAETETDMEVEDETPTETDMVASEDIASLNASDFASMRLVLLTEDVDVISNDSDVIGQYGDVYLLQFTSIQQAMNAYVYYKDKVQAVEPDAVVETAADEDVAVSNTDSPIPMDEENNPIEALNEVGESVEAQESHGVIALIDNGTREQSNVIDRVSVIDDVLGSDGHAGDMVEAIVSQDGFANILSIRALNDDGLGTVSSLVAAMEYAMEQNVDIINLSLYTKATLSTSVLKQEILKAVDAGIVVIGAAGNDGMDAVGYMPGSVEEAYIIGAANEDGTRLETSNFGDTVDYYVASDSTSRAAALFTGFVSANGIEEVEAVAGQGLIFRPGELITVEKPDIDVEESPDIEISDEIYEVRYQIPNVGGEVLVQSSAEGASIVSVLPNGDKDSLTFDEKEGIQIATTISCDKGYVLDSLEVVTDTGEVLASKEDLETDESGSYHLNVTVPSDDMTVKVVFEKDESQELSNSEIYDEASLREYLKDRGYPAEVYENAQFVGQVAQTESVVPENEETAVQTAETRASISRVMLHSNGQQYYPSGGYSTGDYYVTGVNKVAGRAYCMDPVNAAPATEKWYTNITNLDQAEPRNARWYKFCMLLAYGMPLESTGDNVFGAADQGRADYRRVYIHALIGYRNQGVLPGITASEQAGILHIYNSVYDNVMNGGALGQAVDKTLNLYTAYRINIGGGCQDIIFMVQEPPEPEELRASLDVKKVWSDSNNANGTRPSSITISVYRDTDSTVEIKESNRVSTQVLNASNGWSHHWDSVVRKKGDTYYYYAVRETSNPGNYTVSYSHGDGLFVGTLEDGYSATITNTLSTGKGYLVKSSANTGITSGNNNYSLSGAVYTVYSDSGCTKKVGTLTTSSNGTSNTLILAAGTYYVKETTAPKGYAKDNVVHTMVVKSGQTAKLTVSDTPLTGRIDLVKSSGNTSITNGNNNYSLQGAVFTVYKDSACKNKVGTITTDKNGKGSLSNLPFGTYYVKETTAPKGYNLDSTVHTVNVPSTTAVTLNVKDTPQTGNLRVYKKSALPDISDDNNCYSLEGAEFTIYKNSACTEVYKTITTDKDGIAECHDMPLGQYWVKETKAPDTFELNEVWVDDATITANHTTEKPYELTCEDVPGNDPTSIKITKIWDGEETATVPTLEGTQFTIKYYDGYYTKDNLPPTPERTWVLEVKKDKNGNFVTGLADSYLVDGSDELYRDGNGSVCLPYGTITIQETKPAAGYTLSGYLTDKDGNTISTDSEIYVAQINKDSGAVRLEGGNEFTGYNTPIPGKIVLKKFDVDGSTPLAGVTFELKNSKGEVVATETTGSNGEVVFDNLYPDVYTVTEIKTAPGHTLLTENITIEVPMRVDKAYIDKYHIQVYESDGAAENGAKYDPVDDIYYIHNFTYEITNDVTFKMPVAGGVVSSMTFVPLIAGLGILCGLGIVVFRKKRKK